jgi:hypothetical protein
LRYFEPFRRYNGKSCVILNRYGVVVVKAVLF